MNRQDEWLYKIHTTKDPLNFEETVTLSVWNPMLFNNPADAYVYKFKNEGNLDVLKRVFEEQIKNAEEHEESLKRINAPVTKREVIEILTDFLANFDIKKK